MGRLGLAARKPKDQQRDRHREDAPLLFEKFAQRGARSFGIRGSTSVSAALPAPTSMHCAGRLRYSYAFLSDDGPMMIRSRAPEPIIHTGKLSLDPLGSR